MDALADLLAGNSNPRPLVARGRPVAAIFTCIDTRIDPLGIFGRGPGELFCVRTAGHVLAPEVVGSLEIALSRGCGLVLVLGHTDCTAVREARGKEHGHYSVTRHIDWATRGLPAGAGLDEAAEANVRYVVAELRPRLKGRVEGAMLDLATGRVCALGC